MVFAIVRVLGDNMQLSNILKLCDNTGQLNVDNDNIENVMKYLF